MSFGCGSLSSGEVMMMMAKYMKQESTSDVEDESIMPRVPDRFTSMRKVPSLSDLSDPDSSIGEFYYFHLQFNYTLDYLYIYSIPIRFIQQN